MKPLFHFLPLAHVSRTSGSTKMPTIDSTSKTQISPIKKSYTVMRRIIVPTYGNITAN